MGIQIFENKIRAGLFIGQKEENAATAMTGDRVITNKDTLRLNPPDILLTNYKMLDYLLIRPRDFSLWQANGPETLKYLVVDELHTFDGAQGTDLACLIRRLKERLKTPEKHLCCVGTSATLGGKESYEDLQGYSSGGFRGRIRCRFSDCGITPDPRRVLQGLLYLPGLRLSPRRKPKG